MFDDCHRTFSFLISIVALVMASMSDFMSVRNLAAISKRSDTKSWSLFGRTCRNNDHNDDSHVRNMEPRGRIEFLIHVNRPDVSYVRVPNFQKIVIFMVQKSIHRLRRELIDAISIVKYRAVLFFALVADLYSFPEVCWDLLRWTLSFCLLRPW